MSRPESNRQEAWKHFWPEGNGKAKKGYILHHVDETMRHANQERYNQWNPEDLVMITTKEHGQIHRCGKKDSEETKRKKSQAIISNTEWMKQLRERKLFLGHHHTDKTKKRMSESAYHRPPISAEAKQKISERKRGAHWWNNGVEQRCCKECPEGFVLGKLY